MDLPYFSSTICVVVLIFALFTALTAYFLIARALFPAFVQRTEAAWTDRPVASFLIGLPVTGALTFIAFALLNAPLPAARVFGFVASGIALGFVFAGTAGLAARIGRSLGAPSDVGPEWAALLRAGIALELSMIFPILGWFIIAPISV